jgi:c-di-GMP-binding flagellar brake protein YcgR
MKFEINGTNEIKTILDKVIKNKILLYQLKAERRLPISFKLYNYHIDNEKGWIAMVPQNRDFFENVKNEEELVLFFVIDDKTYSFVTEILEVKDNLKGTFTALLPSPLYYIQRRDSYRVKPLKSSKILVNLHTANNKTYKGELFNLSNTGIAVALKNIKGLEVDMEIDFIDFTLPENIPLSLQGEIRHLAKTDLFETGYPYVTGLEFTDIDPASQKFINQYIMKRQIQQIRMKKNDN